MYKLAIKFLVVTLVMTGACLVLSSNSKTLAAPTYCPPGDSVPGDWGNDSDGEGAGVMSSLVMKARDTSGNLLNPHFTLTSTAPGWADNAQIYHWPIGSGGSVSNTDQWPQHGDFQFGTHLSGDGGINCPGWIALGPGIDGNVGNGWVLNCKNPSGNNNIFQITHIDNPSGQSGRWEMYDSGLNLIDSNVNSGGATHIKFPVTNGANMRFTFVWVPEGPPPQPSAVGACRNLSITEAAGSTKTRTYVTVSNVTVNKVHYQHSDGSNSKWWTGLSQSNVNSFVGPGTGGDPPDNPDVAGAPAQNGETNMTVSKEWTYWPSANSITVTYRTDTLSGSTWSNGATQYLYRTADNHFAWSSSPQTISCFSAQCSITSVYGDGPGGIVLAGGTIHVHGTFTNTSPPPDYLDMLAGAYLDTPDGTKNLGFVPYNGYSYDFDINLAAPSDVETYSKTLTPQYNGSESNMSGCGISPNVYQQFTVSSIGAQSDLSPTIEHPNTVNYGATITFHWVNPPANFSHSVNDTVSASLYKKTPSGAISTPCAPSSYSQGSWNIPSPNPPDYYTVWSHSCAIAPGSYVAGDEYCSEVSAQYSGGYVGPDSNVIFGVGPAQDSKCPRVVNEPYFKVYNGDIFTGGEFDQCLDNAHGGGGTLAGYADISDPAGATRGSSSELSALALIKITGVASAQSIVGRNPQNINRPPTNLTFANHNVTVDSASRESPVLGGNFDGCRTLTNESAPPTAPTLGNATLTAPALGSMSGAYKRSGDLTIRGGTLAAGHNVSVFVDGNVYITGPINYGTGWTAGTAPSFVLHATGSIYIKPSVTTLSGLYIAQKNSSGTGGKIYTCANGFTPMSAHDLYTCNNQLVVYGSFVADQVNLMRTFGSLRDEEPNPGSPGGTPAVDLTWSSCGTAGAGLAGESCPSSAQLSTLRCTAVNEPSDTNGWSDNKICVPNSSSVNLYWTHCENYSGCDQSAGSVAGDPGVLYLNSIKNGVGTPGGKKYPYCTQWNVPGDPDTWADNWLCSDQNIGLSFGSAGGAGCVKINELADHDANWQSGYYLCVNTSGSTGPTPKGPPFTACSNKGTETDSKACAAEIFEYSPALYLTSPAVQPPGGGVIQWQAMTNLPPVL